MAALPRLLVNTFVHNTSMRGFLKLYRTPHLTLRIVWTVYLVTMISLLVTASYYLVEHYTSFFVTVQQSEVLQDITAMPSIAVCSERPIGDAAELWWRNGSIVSPLGLHQALRRSMRRAYDLSVGGRRRGKLFAAKDLFYADKISTYFQNIGIRDGRRIGVQAEDLVLFCIMRHSPNNNPSVSHDEICKVSLKWIRHPLYMNCYDVTIAGDVSPEVSSVSLILRSGLAPETKMETLQAQAFDLFTQSVGMRIALHDPGSFPNIDEHGVSVGLGKNTQLRYSLVRYQRINLGSEHSTCLSQAKLRQKAPLVDFDEKYSYTFHACMSSEIAGIILRQCGCVSASHLVSARPTVGKPFCHFHDEKNVTDLEARLDCVRNVRVQEKIREIRRSRCQHRCEFNRYSLQISSSEWVPTQWQLKLILSVSPAWDQAASKRESAAKKREANMKLRSYIHSRSAAHRVVNMTDIDLDRLTLVTVTRSSYNTLNKQETLQITLSTLFAQIGGMGSLTIGLTLTFLFEIFELFYLTAQALRQRSSSKKSEAADGEGEREAAAATAADEVPLK